MLGMVRALSLVIVLTFATGAIAHSVQASSMAFERAVTADCTMPGCNGCDRDDDGNNGAVELTCSPACVAPAVAILGSDTVFVVKTAGYSIALLADESTGLPALIDPYPPKSSVLI